MTLPWLTQFTLSLPCNINVKVCEGPTVYILWNIFPRKGNIRYICLKRPYLDFHIFFRQFFIRNIWLWKMDLSRKKKSHLLSKNLLQVQLLPSDIDPKLAILQVIVFTQVVFPLCRFCNNYILYYKESFKWNVNPVNAVLGTYFKGVYLHFWK